MFRLIYQYLRGPAVLCALLAPLCMIVEVFADLQQPLLMASIIDKGVASGDLAFVIRIGLRMLMYTLLGLAGGAACSILATYASTQLAKTLRVNLFSKTQQLSFAEIDKLETASLITRLTNDVSRVQQLLEIMLRAMFRAPLLCIGGIVMAFLLSPRLALILCVSLPVLILGIAFVISRSIPLYTLVQERLDAVNTVMRENLLGIRVIKAFTLEPQQLARFFGVNDGLTEDSIRAQSTTFLLMPLVMLVMNLSVVAVLWFGGRLAMVGGMEAGKIMAFVNYMVQIANSLAMLAGMLVNIARASASTRRINAVFATEPSVRESAMTIRPEGLDIVFDDVDFSYNVTENVLCDINVTIPYGQKTGIIGSTGSGKSTLVSLIARLYDVTGGSVRIGGTDIRSLSFAELRGKVSMVLQDSLLFSGTVASNLRYGNEQASDTALWKAARAAQAEDFIEALPQQLESRVEQRGSNFSGGQKQRLSIARTLLHEPGILIMDDSFSALDLVTESRLEEAVSQWIGPGTLIIISQRIASLRNCDRILVLDAGRIVDQGTHDELIEQSEIYRTIARSQLGEEYF